MFTYLYLNLLILLIIRYALVLFAVSSQQAEALAALSESLQKFWLPERKK